VSRRARFLLSRIAPTPPDRESQQWVEQLSPGNPRREYALAKLDEFRGLSRLTTWAYKFAVFEVSSKVARHAWQHHPPSRDELVFEQLPDELAAHPTDRLERLEQLHALSTAIGNLSDRQREVFVAIALNEVPIDVLAIELGTNRNAIYKNLFDARRNLRASLAAAGHPVVREDAA